VGGPRRDRQPTYGSSAHEWTGGSPPGGRRDGAGPLPETCPPGEGGQLLDKAGVRPGYAVDDGPFEWERTKAGDAGIPTRPALLLAAISERQRWKAAYDAAQLVAGDNPADRSATTEEAA
jgi:hypothetical protein